MTEVGNREIKEQRRRRPVRVGQGGTVADYVPFYFAPRSPMLYAIKKGNVPGYNEGQDPIVYVVTTVEGLVEHGLATVFTDRNASLAIAAMTTDTDVLDDFVDWPLMNETYWFNTEDDLDRRERRMAECLVHRWVPWQTFVEVATRTEARRAEAESLLAAVGVTATVRVRPAWYF